MMKRKRQAENSSGEKHLKKGELSDDEYFYFSKILDMLNSEESDKDSLMQSVLEAVNESGNIKSLVKNKKVSSILDIVIPESLPSQCENIIKCIEEDIRIFAVDCCGSHVVETLLLFSLKGVQKVKNHSEKEALSEEEKQLLSSFLIKICKFVCNNVDEFILEKYASHVLRMIFDIVNEIDFASNTSKFVKTQHSKSLFKSPKEVKALLPGISQRIRALPSFSDILKSPCGVDVLQHLLIGLHENNRQEDLDTLNDFLLNTLDSNFSSSSDIHNIFYVNPACRLMEVIIKTGNGDQQMRIYKTFFENKIDQLIVMTNGNHPLQRLIEHWKDTETFKALFKKILKHVKESLKVGYSYILVVLAQACNRVGLCHDYFIKQLLSIFECEEKKENLSILLMSLTPLSKIDNLEFREFNLHGVLTIQEMLRFPDVDMVVNGLLTLETEVLKNIACHLKANHVIEVFFKSTSVNEDIKKSLIKKFKDTEIELACSKHGSRSIEAIWESCKLKTKSQICKRLLKSSEKVKNNQFGKIIFYKFDLPIFNENNNERWEAAQNNKVKKQNIYNELMEGFSEDSPRVSINKKTKKSKQKFKEKHNF